MGDIQHPFINALRPLVDRVDASHTWVRIPDVGHRHRAGESLTPERLAAHLNGGPARGVCPIRRGTSVTSVAVLDFDDHDDVSPVPWPVMSLTVARVVDVLGLVWGLTPTLWRSGGGRGVHLYLMWDAPQDAYSVVRFLAGVLADCGLHDKGRGGVAQGRVEIFPKQASVPAAGYGNQFILPGSRASVPLVTEELSGLLDERPGGLATWSMADWSSMGAWADVPVIERPVRDVALVQVDGKPDRLAGPGAPWRQALDALADCAASNAALADRVLWRDCLFAIHHEAGGTDSAEGRELAHAWSQRLPGYVAEEVDKVWDNATLRVDGVTGASVMHHARRLAGWVEPIDGSEFGPVALVGADELGDDGRGGHEPIAGEPWEITEDSDAYSRDRAGAILPTMTNTAAACRVSSVVGMRLAWDEFRGEITVAEPQTNDWRPMDDADQVRIRIALERRGFKTAGAEQVRDAVNLVASQNRYDSAQLWLRGLVPQWDGVRRVDRFLIDSFGCADTPYVRAVARYIWTALAGRVMDPGCQVDMVPLLEGGQGDYKSSAVAALVPDQVFFVEVDLAEDEEKIIRKSKGVLVAEIAELSGLQTRQLEWVKKYVTRRVEKWVPKYKEFATSFKRRMVHFGTTNRTDVLADETGERRWLPVHIVRADVARIVRERDQLWAEGALMWAGELAAETAGIDRGVDTTGAAVVWRASGVAGAADGVAWEDAERLALSTGVHAEFSASDPWESAIGSWLAGDAADDLDGRAGFRRLHPFAVGELLSGALGLGVAAQDMRSQKRAGAVLRRFGFEVHPGRVNGTLRKLWRLAAGVS